MADHTPRSCASVVKWGFSPEQAMFAAHHRFRLSMLWCSKAIPTKLDQPCTRKQRMSAIALTDCLSLPHHHCMPTKLLTASYFPSLDVRCRVSSAQVLKDFRDHWPISLWFAQPHQMAHAIIHILLSSRSRFSFQLQKCTNLSSSSTVSTV
jgi:hypothetical protein